MVTRLLPVLGDQLSHDLASLRAGDKATDVVVMAEVASEARYVPHHPKKIALIFAAMRQFADELRAKGWRVAYTQLDDPENSHSLGGEILRHASLYGCDRVLATRAGEWRVIGEIDALPLHVSVLEDSRFLASHAEFQAWAEGRKQLRMEYFYREMRRKTGLLMQPDGTPEGGKWNYDSENRKRAQPDMLRPKPMRFAPSAATQNVCAMVAQHFGNNFGTLDDFWFATNRAQALQALDHFATHLLPQFGDTQDAMLQDDAFLNHAVLSPYLNLGLLGPMEICQRVAAEYHAGRVPLNAAEGFIRQIIGWREYVRGIYFREGPDYTSRNALGHTRPLPAFYWGAPTRMACVAAAVGQTRQHAYAHHIQRLMVTGNFALLAGVHPHELHQWYLAVYTDAFEWVESPNTIGMSQFADDGIIASKPYVSSGAYIDRMSDYCGSCAYKVKEKTGPRACPFNLLYWDFLMRHEGRFAKNPRMAQMYRTWARMAPAHRETVLRDAASLLARLDAGEVV